MSATIIQHFFRAYFDEDWRLDHESPAGAVRAFVAAEGDERRLELLQQLQSAVTRGIPAGFIWENHGYVVPSALGMTEEEFVRHLVDVLGGAA